MTDTVTLNELVQRARKIEQANSTVSAVSTNGMGRPQRVKNPESEIMQKLEELSTSQQKLIASVASMQSINKSQRSTRSSTKCFNCNFARDRRLRLEVTQYGQKTSQPISGVCF